MDSTDEPQKKIFKARKTMRVSDRQQLEAVYKVKEELLKTTEVKLLNGKHENGDSDLNSPLSNTDSVEIRREVNGVVDLCVNSEEGRTASDEINEAKSPESRAGNVVNDMESKLLAQSPDNVTPEQDKDPDTALACEADSGVLGSNKDNFHEENNTKDHLDQRESEIPSEGESKSICDISESSEEKRETNDLTVNSSSPGEEKRTEEVTAEDAVGEETISSSMEADQEPKDKQDSTAGLSETSVQKTIDEPSGSILDNTDCMETDEIIPILEKLAPAEDELSCFSKSSLLPADDTIPDLEEKMDSCLGSPSKQESNESLPKEAFLVLSDEEDPCDEKEEHAEVILPNKTSLPEEVEEETRKESEEDKEEEAHKEEEKHTEKSEVSRRKRSKSEDMDSVHSKRRRYIAEDYEAELQVKITARKDVDEKLQKVIQRLLEEKLTALQCAVFDKTLEDLKTRIEKVECNKRHKTVLTELQAKIARLTKRFGAAREDLKKRQENPPNAPLSPVKAASDTANTNSATYRNAGTVRQMLESKRNVGESTPATFQAPVNAVPASSLAAPPAVVSGHSKPQTPVTSTSSLTTTVIPAATAATVVGTNQVPSGSTQSVSVSLQSLPVILHVPVAVSSQPQLLQGHTGTLVTNQQSGNVEFISVQSSSTVGSLTKPTVSLASTNPTKPNNSPSVPSPGIQRNSPASAGSIGTTLAVQAVSAAHPVAQATRTTLPTVGTSGLYNATSSRAPLQMKIPLSAFSSTAPIEPPTVTAPRVENQTSRPPTDTSANKRTAEGTPQLKQEETSSENKEAVEAAQTNFNFPEDVLFGLEEEEEDAKSIKNTHKQTGWAANLLKQWLAKNGKDPSFELVPVSELNDILREFYYTVRNHDGNTYSVASYKSMRAGLNRHLKMPPYNRQICLMKDKEFASANMVFVSVLKMLRMQGKDETHHHPPIAAEDLRKIKQSGVLGLHSPLALVNKVWFDLQLHFAKRGREILRDLAPDAFVVEKDKNGRRYAMFRYPGKGKNGEDPHKMGKMYDMPGDPNCPVFSLELYLSKLPPEPPAFYLHPLKLTSEQMQEQPVWYKREPMGVNYLGTMMPRISVAARLSQRYTNHSLRTTTIQLLCEAGLGPREIMAVTGHRSESAIRHYWGAAEVRYRAWSDIMENNSPNYLFSKIPNEVIKEPLSGASTSSINHVVLEQRKILFPKKSVVPPDTNSVTLVPEGHPALKPKSPVLLNHSSSKVLLPKNVASGNLTVSPLQGCCNETVFIKRVIKQEPMT
ncbi:PREDICTED: activating transcription factor 7-interacting protein 1 isoform X1 [Calidris pugnax]|uniref:activating transcription factor 7-interacting protein 1 isoform X1 n=1 Tax=Calidris pugnax TaxID=198806 RepID=UPI00071D85F6|nr:PREDICTED: activating transcription factor 7-interacting protein 1 isoform X1 [Calidris pugnax]XP_014819070.1 PREDICTED: activating transcription factor 7-interacting protein 1 isoform X1 [Calidris pugnax]XP_014819071.1 PREDICTED: activating transcription factor 7-interacting protein 1 isoform X1 [Calidris pugnax]XP_014819072.1 PREDICTED: activating transcription factor 7-interacting protein 1 isoform X1 [Calidris pugnax]XP_014819073.1 PREDICTED: activating transcription factor 7-interacting